MPTDAVLVVAVVACHGDPAKAASFDCRARCQYCGSCTTDKTWDQCNAICNGCKQGCEQNERFCQAACGN